jgi:transcriptional regulator with XRE-family HTH domain
MVYYLPDIIAAQPEGVNKLAKSRSAPTEFSSLVHGYLYKHGLTQEWLAEQVDLDPSSLSRIMKGHRNPTARLALAISEVLGLSEAEKHALLAAVPQRRRSGVLASPLRAEPPPESGSGEAPTIGQDIDAALKEEGFLEAALKEDYEKLRQSLVSHVRQLAQLYMLAKRGENEAD